MRTAPEAAKVFKQKDRNEVGMCLKEVQLAYAGGNMYPSAINQWDNAKQKHRDDKTPPVGAPVFYQGGRYGHVAIYIGNGMVRSTDAGGRGVMGTKPLNWFQAGWGYKYLGWTGDIANRSIDFDTKKHVYVDRLKPGVDDSDSVMHLRRALIKRGFLAVQEPLSVKRPGNKYTPAVERAVAKWQTKHGYKPDGVMGAAQVREFFKNNDNVVVHA